MPDYIIKDPQRELNTFSQVQHQLTEVPRQVRIETAARCTMKCTWCHAWGDFSPMQRAPGFMDVGLFDQIIDDIAVWPQPLRELVPTVWGELFLHPKWAWMLQRIGERLPKTRLHLVTTGLALAKPDNLERLAQAPTLKYLNVSLNAFFGETWQRIHQVPAKHMLGVVQAVHAFRDRRPDVTVNVSMVQDPDITTELEADLFLRYWEQFGQASVSSVSFAGHPRHVPDPPVTLSCRSVVDGLVVLNTGLVGTGCCFWNGDAPELAIGHFPEEGLLAIWKGTKLRSLVETHNSGRRSEIKLCSGCTFA